MNLAMRKCAQLIVKQALVFAKQRRKLLLMLWRQMFLLCSNIVRVDSIILGFQDDLVAFV